MPLQIKASGVDIITIGVGQWTRQTELRRLASRPEERNTLHVADYDTLFQASDLILSSVCNGTQQVAAPKYHMTSNNARLTEQWTYNTLHVDLPAT